MFRIARRFPRMFFIFAASILVTPTTAQDVSQYAITNVNCVDVESGKIQKSQTIILKDGKIETIGPASSISVPKSAQRIDGSGKYAIPGLWDMHIHWYDEKSMQLFPLNGVTGVRFMWGIPQHHTWKKNFAERKKLGPQMVIGSTIVDGPDPYWSGSIVAKNADQGREAVQKVLKQKSEFVKVYSFLPRDAYFAIAKACKENKLDFAGHVPIMVSAAEASDAGQRSMEHLYEILLACSSAETELRKRLTARRNSDDSPRAVAKDRKLRREIVSKALETYDEDKAKKLFEKFAKNDTYQCPTLTVLRNLAYLTEDKVQKNPNLKYIPIAFARFIAPKQRSTKLDETAIKRSRVLLKQNMKILATMQKAKVPIIAGTDCLNPFCLPGFSLHTELELMVEAGLEPIDALRAATINAARFRRAEKTDGSLKAGKTADVVLLNANPLEKITNTRKIESVFVRGVYLDRDFLDRHLAALDNSKKSSNKNKSKK